MPASQGDALGASEGACQGANVSPGCVGLAVLGACDGTTACEGTTLGACEVSVYSGLVPLRPA